MTVRFDPTNGDRALAEARADITIGRWQGLPGLCAAAGSDWDRRTFRMRLLAQATAGTSVAESWHESQPQNADALVLRAETEVMRAFNLAMAAGPGNPVDPDQLERAVRTALRAAEAFPADPVPWVSLLTVARLFPGGHPSMELWWKELHQRDPYNREGNHQVLRHLSARWHGSHGVMYNFAQDVTATLPPGSPLAVLPQVARIEEYRYRVEREGSQAIGLLQFWNNENSASQARRAWHLWMAQRQYTYAQDVADLNTLAHASCYADLTGEAAHLFRLLDGHATRVPWSCHGAPEEIFTRWQSKLLG
ncbi:MULTISPECIES: hypothetical protein [unclassified Streptomyces]|uniref:hypothetical protein n=1 Tax=unclassified Streptomyces TaxID=2593676 RepID=UPI00225B963F|nr:MULTISPECIES: hypothetical protein [unclassified Streptomyces]MCX5439851.1 hypothetical protein [Streptomyces sp. NBC_00063]WSE17386.1 hypothetical protein OG518_30845 [Streptomyces sp. NBC_01397]WUB93723.1 hypothetical protein OHO83_16195 [Streptomyces sp. NBC_00569]